MHQVFRDIIKRVKIKLVRRGAVMSDKRRSAIYSALSARTILVLLIGIVLIVLTGSNSPISVEAAVDLVHEIGFALVVAFVIWTLFEVFSFAATEAQWSRRIEGITHNVFFGVLRRNLPPDLIAEAHQLILDKNLIRDDISIAYVLDDGTFTDEHGVEGKYVALSAMARYQVRNVGSGDEIFKVAISLPNPLVPGLKEKCGITKVMVRHNGREVPIDLQAIQSCFRANISRNGTKSEVGVECCSISLKAGEKVDVTFGYVMAKEEEDTEIFETMIASRSLSFTILDRSPGKRHIQARSIHRAELEDHTPDHSAGSLHYRMSNFLLPHQGFIIWWKRIRVQEHNDDPDVGAAIAKDQGSLT